MGRAEIVAILMQRKDLSPEEINDGIEKSKNPPPPRVMESASPSRLISSKPTIDDSDIDELSGESD